MQIAREQFEKLAIEHLDMMYRIARRMTHDPARAEDLVQETYLRALRGRESFDLQEYGIRPWLVRIMRNLHFSRSERERRQPAAMESEALEAAQPAGNGGSTFPSIAGGFEMLDGQLVKALENIPEDYQTVLLLWAVEELSYKEIADAMEIPIGTVMSRLHRARQRLSVQLHDYAVKEGMIRE